MIECLTQDEYNLILSTVPGYMFGSNYEPKHVTINKREFYLLD